MRGGITSKTGRLAATGVRGPGARGNNPTRREAVAYLTGKDAE